MRLCLCRGEALREMRLPWAARQYSMRCAVVFLSGKHVNFELLHPLFGTKYHLTSYDLFIDLKMICLGHFSVMDPPDIKCIFRMEGNWCKDGKVSWEIWDEAFWKVFTPRSRKQLWLHMLIAETVHLRFIYLIARAHWKTSIHEMMLKMLLESQQISSGGHYRCS